MFNNNIEPAIAAKSVRIEITNSENETTLLFQNWYIFIIRAVLTKNK